MSRRVIDFARQDEHGRIVAIGNGAEPWSPVSRPEAVSQIESGEHSYVVLSDGHMATVGVVDGRYLRTWHNNQEVDNLDALAGGAEGAPGLTGSFDLVITLGDDALRRVVAALHAASVIEHAQILVQDGQQIEVSMASPRIAPAPSADGAESTVSISTRLHCTASRLDDALDPGFSAAVDVVRRARLDLRIGGDQDAELRLSHEPPVAEDIQILSPLAADQQEALRRALSAWLRRDRPESWHTTLPAELAFVTHAGCRVTAPGALQVGFGAEGAVPSVYPTPEPGDWTVSISRWQLARRVYDALAAQLGAVPPPAGSSRVLIDPARKIYLRRLSVSLDEGEVVLTGALQKTSAPTLNATFVARVTLGLTATGLVRIDDVATEVTVQEWYAVLADFVSGGSFTRALRQGIRDALAGEAGSGRPLLTAGLLNDVASFGLDRRLRLKPTITRLSVRPSGLVLGGPLEVPASTGPVPQLTALADASGTTLLHGSDSWAAGGTLVDARWSFGDGTQLHTSGPGLKLAVVHRYAPGAYTSQLTLTDDRGAAASVTASLRVR